MLSLYREPFLTPYRDTPAVTRSSHSMTRTYPNPFTNRLLGLQLTFRTSRS
jgi:hypothetical protein